METERDDYQNAELWVRELKEAGWTEVRVWHWKDPQGASFLGPYGAWRRMRERKKMEVRSDG